MKKLLAFFLIPTFVVVLLGACGNTLGVTTQGASAAGSINYAYAVGATVVSSGTIDTINVYFTAEDASVQAALYNDNGSQPGTVIGTSSSQSAAVGWNQIPLASPVAVTAGQVIWFAVEFNGSTTRWAYDSTTWTMSRYYTPLAFGTFSNGLSWTNYTNIKISIYGTECISGLPNAQMLMGVGD